MSNQGDFPVLIRTCQRMILPVVVFIGMCYVVSSYFATTTHWRYSYIPDQITFYEHAHTLAFNSRYDNVWTFVRENILDPHGVYNKHHRADTLWLALSLKLFGPSPFGWRICSILFGLSGGLIVLLIVRKITNSLFLGGVAALLLLLSPPYYAMSHFGYNNIYVVPFMLLPVLLSLYDLSVSKYGVWLLIGMMRGWGFYTFTAGLTYIVWDILVCVCAIASSNQPEGSSVHRHRALICVGAYVAGLAVIALPTAMQPDYFSYLFNYGESALTIRKVLDLTVDALLFPVRYSFSSGHGSHGAFWGAAGWLVFAGWIFAFIPARLVSCPASLRWNYLLRLLFGATILVGITLAVVGHIRYTRSFVLIPLFVMSATLAITPLYRRFPLSAGGLCVALLACEGLRCLYLQQQSMEGVWQQSRIICVAEKTTLPICYVTGPKPFWWQDLYFDKSDWPGVYGFGDRYRTSPSAEGVKAGEIVIEDGKPTRICDCDLR